VADATDLSAHFSILADPRVERPKKHRLIDPPTGGFIAVCTMICGGGASPIWGCSARPKRSGCTTALELPHGIPSHDRHLQAGMSNTASVRWAHTVPSRSPSASS